LDVEAGRLKPERRAFQELVAPYAALGGAYDSLWGDHFFPRLRRTFEWLVRHYRFRVASLADVACGTGTFVRYAAEAGVPTIYGVDASPHMLAVAIAKNRGTDARFLLQDFATVQLPQTVELITCHFDALNYLLTGADLLRAFRRFHANLSPGGHLMFDMITDRPPLSDGRPECVRAAGMTVIRRTHWDSRRGRQTAVVSVGRDGHSRREVHVQRGFPVRVVVARLLQARFSPLGVHDYGTLGPVMPWTIRAAYLARKCVP
jgi:SAM-dependent methyltransferase